MHAVRLAVVWAVLALVSSPQRPSAWDKWPSIDPADLSLMTPRVDPSADAEVLLWDVRVTDRSGRDSFETEYEHHLRVKIFTDRGRAAHGKVDLTYTPGRRLRDIEARTVSRDGRTTEVRNHDIFDRSIVEASGVRVKARAFAFPAVVPGSIVEHRWREIRDGTLSMNLVLDLQRDIPVQLVRYHIKPPPLRHLRQAIDLQSFNAPKPDVSRERNGYTRIESRNLPALRREPFMPPELSVKSWILLYSRPIRGDVPEAAFWTDYARQVFNSQQTRLRVTEAVERAAAEAMEHSSGTLGTRESPGDVAASTAAILRFVRARVKRTDVDTAEPTRPTERGSRSVTETLQRGSGDRDDVTRLFVALANASGLHARIALIPDRAYMIGAPSIKQPFLFRHLAAAVHDGHAWQFFDPGHGHARLGHLRWQQEGLAALILDDEAPALVETPIAPPEYSLTRRTAALRLLADGTLVGHVRLVHTGHMAAQLRERDAGETAAARERVFRKDFEQRIPGARVSEYVTEQLDAPDEPYVEHFEVHISGYAQRTGTRMFLQPAVNQRGAVVPFTAGERKYEIHFPFARAEEDTVTIELPDGFELESPAAPAPIDGGVMAGYEAGVTADAASRRVTYTRSYHLGGDGRVFFLPAAHDPIKGFFNAVHAADGHTLTLRRRDARAGQQ